MKSSASWGCLTSYSRLFDVFFQPFDRVFEPCQRLPKIGVRGQEKQQAVLLRHRNDQLISLIMRVEYGANVPEPETSRGFLDAVKLKFLPCPDQLHVDGRIPGLRYELAFTVQ